MIVYKIVGGFASQVFKFIIGYQLAKKIDTDLVLDLSDYYNGYYRPYMLCYLNLPNVKYVYGENALKMSALAYNVKNSNDMEYIIENGNIKNYYIGIENVLFNDFLANHSDIDVNEQSCLVKNLKLVRESDFLNGFKCLLKANSVAIHIRRGDFCGIGWNDEIEYYKAAIGYYANTIKSPSFYFFSNDLEWCYNQFGFKDNYYYVNSANGFLGDVEVFFAMSLCKYRVLTSMSGYGLLANIVSRAQYDGQYALISGNKDLDSNYSNFNLNNALEYDRNRKGIVSLVGLDYKNGLDTFLKDYDIKTKHVADSIKELSESKMIESHMYNNNVYCEILQNKITEYHKNNEYYNLRECLEVYDEYFKDDLKYTELWADIYKGLRKIEYKTIYINNKYIYINTYFINGYTRLFKMYSRLGYDIRINTCNTIQCSLSMNGTPFGFSFKNYKIGRISIAIKRRLKVLFYRFISLLYNFGLINVERTLKKIIFYNSDNIKNPVQIYDLLDESAILNIDINKYILNI